MYNQNKFEFIGHIATNPETRALDGNKRVCKLRIAINEVWRDKDGKRQERAEFLDLSVFNDKTIDMVEKHVRTGMYMMVSGKVSSSKKERDGETSYYTNLIAQRFNFLQPKDNGPDQIGDETE